MTCTAVDPNLTAAEQAHFVSNAIAPGLFRIKDPPDDDRQIAWRVSPEPFALSPATLAKIEAIGPDLLAFYRALNNLYNRSARGTAPAFIAEYLDMGKPENVVRLARQNRFKQDVPLVIRPDLLLTENGLIASELDSVPGGMGFVGAMADAYCKLGIESIGGVDGMPREFGAMLAGLTGVEKPVVAVVVSDESGDYRNEMRWLAEAVRALGAADAHVCEPQDLLFTEEAMFLRIGDDEPLRLHAIYRNFELFDLMNVPKQELVLYAARHNRVKVTPPPKANLEEKLAFALLHHCALETLWRKELGNDVYGRLQTLFPRTWVLDPRPLPPQAVIEGLHVGGQPVRDWRALLELGKSDREYVVKPSGFSELAWGSKGVKIANDLTRDEWSAALENGLASFERTPHILQRFHKGKRLRQSYLDRTTDEIRTYDGRVRLCPYYFVINPQAGGETEVRLGGILATVAPADKRLIHGMSDAVMASCFVKENGY